MRIGRLVVGLRPQLRGHGTLEHDVEPRFKAWTFGPLIVIWDYR